MLERLLFTGAVILVVTSVLNWANSKAKATPEANSAGVITLRMNKLYFFVGIASLIIISFCSLGPGIPCLLWYLYHRVSYDIKQFNVRSLSGKEKNHSIQRCYIDQTESYDRFFDR